MPAGIRRENHRMNALPYRARRPRAIHRRATRHGFRPALAALLALAVPAAARAQAADEAPWVVDGSTYIPDPGAPVGEPPG